MGPTLVNKWSQGKGIDVKCWRLRSCIDCWVPCTKTQTRHKRRTIIHSSSGCREQDVWSHLASVLHNVTVGIYRNTVLSLSPTNIFEKDPMVSIFWTMSGYCAGPMGQYCWQNNSPPPTQMYVSGKEVVDGVDICRGIFIFKHYLYYCKSHSIKN